MPNMIKCPVCDLELPEDDLRAQAAHMDRWHPQFVQARMAPAQRDIAYASDDDDDDGWISDDDD